MRRFLTVPTAILTAAILTVGCSSGDDTADEAETTATAAPAATVASPETASTDGGEKEVDPIESVREPRATFDGQTATYSGPTSLTAGEITFTFDATEYDSPNGVMFIVAEVTDDSLTMEDIEALAATQPASAGIPPFIGMIESFVVRDEVVEATYSLTEGRWQVSAHTSPQDTDRIYPATILEVTSSEEASVETIATTPAGMLVPTFELTFDGTRCGAEGPSAVAPGEITVLLINESDLLVATAVRRLDDGYTAQDWLDTYPPGEWHDREPWIHDVPQLGLGLPEGITLPEVGTVTKWQVGVSTDPGQHEIHLGILNEGLWGCTGFVVTDE